MCERRGVRGGAAGPRWGRLYAVVSVALAALALVPRLTPAPALRTALEAGLAIVLFAAMLRWVRGSAAALDLLDWCDCARGALTVRELHPAGTRRRAADRGGAGRAGDRGGADAGEPAAAVR